ncbi:MAG TPA: M1 family metallopeptidase, partial [Gemmatimonadaceae bacterium]|nr:M1 family metallopeptidase [Gemmatimonadaceae bacterium]
MPPVRPSVAAPVVPPRILPRAARAVALAVALPLAACTTSGNTPPQPPAPAGPPPDSLAARRPIPHPVRESPGFARAVANGTRTRLGTPGPKYWEQYARYHITGTLQPELLRFSGEERVTYYNRSPDTLNEIWVNLNQNLFAPNGVRNGPVPATEGMEMFRVRAGGRSLAPVDSGPGYQIDATRMRITLPRPLPPGQQLELEFAWGFDVPPDGAPREGSMGDVFMIAYWYPQIAVYDDVNGWHTDPYMGQAEFYMGYADYDVALTVPAGWLVAATGELVNASTVLSPTTQQRLQRARTTGEYVRVVTEAERGAGRATAGTPGATGQTLTWRFRASNVRDFAFGASSRWLWDATTAAVGDRDGDGRPDSTVVNSFYRPEARAWAWDQSMRYGRHAIEFLSSYLWPYPYPQMTALEGPRSCGGMEYPMLTCIGGPRDTLSLYSVTVHEFAHMWFPMQVGSDERRYAWMDEGLTRFNQAQGMRAFFRGYDREAQSREAYLNFARTGGEVELMRHGDLYPYGTPAYGIATYEKMATNLVALRAIMGDSAFRAAYRDYGIRWIGRHPTPYDFFYAFERNAHRDLDWFWSPWWYETWTLDQGIAEVRAAPGDSLQIVIEDRGLVPMPVRLAVTRGGATERLEVPVTAWLTGARRYTVTVDSGSAVTAVTIDPEQAFADVDRR